MAESFIEKRRRELGLDKPAAASNATPARVPGAQTSPAVAVPTSFVGRRRLELGIDKLSPQQLQTMLPAGSLSVNNSLNTAKSFVDSQITPETRQKVVAADAAKAAKEAKKSPEQKELEAYRTAGGSRDLPVIGPVLRGLDWLADKTKPAADVAQSLYTPGGGLTAVNTLTKGTGAVISRALPALERTTAGRAIQTGLTEAAVGAPLGASHALAQTGDLKQAKDEAVFGAATGGALGLVGKALAPAFSRFLQRTKAVAPELEQATRDALESSQVPSQYRSVQTGTLRNASNDSYLSHIMGSIRDDVYQQMTPPLENPNELAKWIRPHLGEDVSLNEIRKLSYDDMTQLANEIRSNMSMHDVASRVAKSKGFDLDAAFAGKRPSLKDQVTSDQSRRAYGIYDAPQVKPARSLPREGSVQVSSEPSLPGAPAVAATDDIETLARQYQAADQALQELDQRYSSGGTPTPEDVQRMMELQQVKSDLLQRAGRLPEGVKARVNGGGATGAPPPNVPPAGPSLPGNVRARVASPAGQRSSGPTRATSKPTKTISRAQLVERIRKNLGVVIDSGRTGYDRSKVLGVFKTQPGVIRTGYAEDVETIAHELGHHLSKKHDLLDRRFEQELLDMMDTQGVHNYRSYPRSEWHEEGVAEFLRTYLSDPQQARQLAPNFSAFLDSKLPKNVRKGLRNVQQDVQTWINQGEYDQAVGMVDFEGGGGKAKGNWNRWYTRFVDDLNPIKIAEKALSGAIGVGKDSIYKMARLSRGVGEQAKMAVTRGIFDSQGNKISDGLQEIVKPLQKIGMSEKDFGTYLAVVHAEDLRKMGKVVPFSEAQARAVLQRLGSNPVVQKAQQEIVKYNNALLDLMVDSGLLSPKVVAEMRAKYPNYVPFQRYFDDDAVAGFKNGGYGSSSGFVNVTTPVKRMSEEGSDRSILNPVESMVKNTFLVMNAAAKNKVGLQLADLAKIDGAGKWVEHVPGASDDAQHIIFVKVNGDKQAFKIRDPELYNAMLSLDNESSNSLLRFLGGMASVLRGGATLTPEFMIRNAFRDVAGAMVNSTKYGFTPLDFMKGFMHTVRKTDVYEKFVNSGGAMSTMMALDRDTNREALEAVFKKSLKDKTLNVVTSPKELAKWLSLYRPVQKTVDVLRKGAEISELSTKIGTFNRVLKKTGDIEEAAYSARDLMDFNRAGSNIRQANKAIAFLNASIQGTDKMVRAFKENKASFLTRAFTTLALPASLVYFWNKYQLSEEDQQAFANIPQWQKDSFYVIGVGGGKFVRIPKPFEAGMLFATSTERMLQWLEANDPEAFEEYGRATAESVTPPMLFTALTPLLEATTNHSFFRNAPIVPQGEQRYEKKDQYGIYTSEVAKELGQLADKVGLGETNAASPRIIDNTLKGYTAGLGQYGVDAVDKVIDKVSGKKKTPEPAKKLTESPFFRSFFATTSGGGQVREDFYDAWDKISKKKASADRDDQILPIDQQRQYMRMKAGYNAINKLNKRYKAVRDSKDIDADTKRSKMDELDAKMNEAAAKALEAK
ncbi:LPD38 domain-containing protein [Cohnella sp. GCM10012308]|uniref:LPD38 domain-containing protein n=1 Tax=Cohnella sp. GCM10012308 TaxID=3317329 RepID=UPI00360DC3A7